MVRYALTSSIPFSALSQFTINRDNGELTLVESLDRETDPTITLRVTASDMGEPRRNNQLEMLTLNNPMPILKLVHIHEIEMGGGPWLFGFTSAQPQH